MMRQTMALLCALGAAATTYPYTYTNCGVEHTVDGPPNKTVTMNQGMTEFMLAMGLQDNMAATAYLDDSIWPAYETAYNAIPVLASGYPTDAQLMGVNVDFIMANYKSAFSEKPRSETSTSGIFTNTTVGPCQGRNSDWFPAGSNATMSYGTCRPQLHAAGIGTWLETTYCEDSDLRPSTATEDTVYDAVTQLGEIFNVRSVAAQLNAEIANDFAVAKQTVESSGHGLTAILLDGVGCSGDPDMLFVGAGEGSVNLIMTSAGLTNLFADLSGSYACVSASDIIDANPDVLLIIEASWDSALNKIDHMHNKSDWCAAKFVQQADYITIPFSASALGPRNGVAALDLVSAAIHVTTGATTMNFQSGVEFFDPDVLVSRTANLLCPLALTDMSYSGVTPAPTVSAATVQVAITIGMSGITCADYGDEEEAAVNSALGDHIDGADAEDFDDHVCADSTRRRTLLSGSVSISTSVAVASGSYDDDDVAGSVASTLSSAVSSGSFTQSVTSYAEAAGLSTLASASVSSASAASDDDDDSTTANQKKDNGALLTIIIILAVVVVGVCLFAAFLVTKEQAGEPMFKPLKDMDSDGMPMEEVGAPEVGVEIVPHRKDESEA